MNAFIYEIFFFYCLGTSERLSGLARKFRCGPGLAFYPTPTGALSWVSRGWIDVKMQPLKCTGGNLSLGAIWSFERAPPDVLGECSFCGIISTSFPPSGLVGEDVASAVVYVPACI